MQSRYFIGNMFKNVAKRINFGHPLLQALLRASRNRRLGQCDWRSSTSSANESTAVAKHHCLSCSSTSRTNMQYQSLFVSLDRGVPGPVRVGSPDGPLLVIPLCNRHRVPKGAESELCPECTLLNARRVRCGCVESSSNPSTPALKALRRASAQRRMVSKKGNNRVAEGLSMKHAASFGGARSGIQTTETKAAAAREVLEKAHATSEAPPEEVLAYIAHALLCARLRPGTDMRARWLIASGRSDPPPALWTLLYITGRVAQTLISVHEGRMRAVAKELDGVNTITLPFPLEDVFRALSPELKGFLSVLTSNPSNNGRETQLLRRKGTLSTKDELYLRNQMHRRLFVLDQVGPLLSRTHASGVLFGRLLAGALKVHRVSGELHLQIAALSSVVTPGKIRRVMRFHAEKNTEVCLCSARAREWMFVFILLSVLSYIPSHPSPAYAHTRSRHSVALT